MDHHHHVIFHAQTRHMSNTLLVRIQTKGTSNHTHTHSPQRDLDMQHRRRLPSPSPSLPPSFQPPNPLRGQCATGWLFSLWRQLLGLPPLSPPPNQLSVRQRWTEVVGDLTFLQWSTQGSPSNENRIWPKDLIGWQRESTRQRASTWSMLKIKTIKTESKQLKINTFLISTRLGCNGKT